MSKVLSILTGAVKALLLGWTIMAAPHLLGGGSGLNTVVVVNQNSSNSLELANYFCEQKSVPPENVLRIQWSGGNISWSGSDFTNLLLNPLGEMLQSRGLTDQIDYVVLSMDIPFQTLRNTSDWNGTTSALFYGLKVNNPGAPANLNTYAGSETAFAIHRTNTANAPAFLVTMLTAGSLSAAKQMVDQGVRGNGNVPAQPVILAKSSDPNRNFRSGLFDNAIFNTRIRGAMSIERVDSDDPSGLNGLLGYQTGLARFEVSSNAFVPGAISDSVTSYGGRIFGPNDQTNLLEFIHAGATGSYGTVAEPLADPDKFPNPLVYFYQTRGFSLGESYYQSLRKPYLGLIVGEPLSAPFAAKGRVFWSMLSSNQTVTGTELQELSFQANDASRPIQQVDFFIDGRFFSTLTNLSPRAGNVLTLSLNGLPINYTVPASASLSSIASNLAALINDPAVTNTIPIRATSSGDRIELQASQPGVATWPYYVVDDTALFTNTATYRARYFARDFPPALLPVGMDKTGAFSMMLQVPTPQYCVVEASTDLNQWLPVFTNITPGLVEFRDAQSTAFSHRFYRIVAPVQPPKISIGPATNGSVYVRTESQPGQPCALLASTNAANWTILGTNQVGGVFDWVPGVVGEPASRFFRAWLVPPPSPIVSVSNLTSTAALVRVDSAAQPFVVERSMNGTDWTALATNFAFRDIQITARSAQGSADMLTTSLHAARPIFQLSAAHGIQSYTFLAATLTSGAWAEFIVEKTNGTSVRMGVTNMTAGISVTNLALAMFNRINAEASLHGSDGVVAEDFYVNAGAQAKFNLRARSGGEPASQLGVQVNVSGFATGVSVSPATYRKLNKNLDDLRSRNHVYVTAGLPHLEINYPFNTQTLPDGFHELTLVGYEGSSVRSQTHRAAMVRVQNTGLTATLETTNVLSVSSNLNVRVTPNTNSVAEILLFSTGGLVGGKTNVAEAVFSVSGSYLGVGKHPFYALVTTTNGHRYRTETRYVDLTRP